MLSIEWRIKFRAFGVTFGTVNGRWNYPALLPPFDHVLVNDRGVWIRAWVSPPEPA
jgi:hypothetical protein